MPPKHFLGVILLSLLALLAVLYFVLQRADVFPQLRPVCDLPEGYAWVYGGGGEDFYTYHAADEEAKAGIGIYFGLHPDVQDVEMKSTEKGSVGEFEVAWNIFDDEKSLEHKYFRECLFKHRPGWNYLKLNIHLWVYSNTLLDNEVLLQSLKKMEFSLKE